jgi:hypothetical protein
MIEQVICAQGRIFVGTYWSTFSGYIMRMRGYKGYGKRSYFALPKYRDKMIVNDERRKGAGWWREWPEAWENIDAS